MFCSVLLFFVDFLLLMVGRTESFSPAAFCGMYALQYRIGLMMMVGWFVLVIIIIKMVDSMFPLLT